MRGDATRRERLLNAVVGLVFLGVVGVTLRAWLLRSHTLNFNDGYSYAFLAQRWTRGDFWGGVTSYWSPLYPGLAAVFRRAGAGLAESLWLANLAALGANVLLIFLLARACRISMTGAALTAGLTLTLFVRYLFLTTPDLVSSAAALLLALGYLRDKERPTPLSALGLGFAVSLAYLAKLHLALYGAALLALSFRARLSDSRLSVRQRLTHLGLAGVGLLPLITWAGALGVKYHRLTLGDTGGMALKWYFGLSQYWDTQFVTPGASVPCPWFDPSLYGLAAFPPDPAVRNVSFQLHRLAANMAHCLTILLNKPVLALLAAGVMLGVLRWKSPRCAALWQAALALLVTLLVVMVPTDPQQRFFGPVWALGLLLIFERAEGAPAGRRGGFLGVAALIAGVSGVLLYRAPELNSSPGVPLRSSNVGEVLHSDRALFATDDFDLGGHWALDRGWRFMLLPQTPYYRPYTVPYDPRWIPTLERDRVELLALTDEAHIEAMSSGLSRSGWVRVGEGLWRNPKVSFQPDSFGP